MHGSSSFTLRNGKQSLKSLPTGCVLGPSVCRRPAFHLSSWRCTCLGAASASRACGGMQGTLRWYVLSNSHNPSAQLVARRVDSPSGLTFACSELQAKIYGEYQAGLTISCVFISTLLHPSVCDLPYINVHLGCDVSYARVPYFACLG